MIFNNNGMVSVQSILFFSHVYSKQIGFMLSIVCVSVCLCVDLHGHSAFVGPSLERCTLACSYCLGAQQNFVDSLPAAVAAATCIAVLASVVARPLASDTDPFDVLAASFAWN